MIASRDNVIIIPQIAGVYASGVLTSNNTNVADNATVTIGSQVYRFKTIMLAVNDVQIGSSADASLANLVLAINGQGNPGVDYFTGTVAHTLVSASSVAAHAITITAKSLGTGGNGIATTETSNTLSFADSTLTGGAGGQVKDLTLAAGTYNTEAIDVGTLIELLGFINVHSHSGTPTLDIKMQLSPDKKTWVDSADAFTQVTTADTLTFKRFTVGFGKFIRFVIAVANTNPVYNLDLIVIGKA